VIAMLLKTSAGTKLGLYRKHHLSAANNGRRLARAVKRQVYGILRTHFLHGADNLLEKLTGSQQVKKLPALLEPEGSLPCLQSAQHMSLSLARSVHSMPHHPTS